MTLACSEGERPPGAYCATATSKSLEMEDGALAGRHALALEDTQPPGWPQRQQMVGGGSRLGEGEGDVAVPSWVTWRVAGARPPSRSKGRRRARGLLGGHPAVRVRLAPTQRGARPAPWKTKWRLALAPFTTATRRGCHPGPGRRRGRPPTGSSSQTSGSKSSQALVYASHASRPPVSGMPPGSSFMCWPLKVAVTPFSERRATILGWDRVTVKRW